MYISVSTSQPGRSLTADKIATLCCTSISTMGMVLMPALVITFAVGYLFRDSEIPVPDLGAFLGDNEPKSVYTLALENYVIWASVFSLAHFVLYVKPQRSFFHPFKLNPNYPPTSLIFKEIGRSVRGKTVLVQTYKIIDQVVGDLSLPHFDKLQKDCNKGSNPQPNAICQTKGYSAP